MSDEVYHQLREFLDKMPAGFPSTPEGTEIKILKKMFTPEEARIALVMQPMPEKPSAIAERLGMDEREAAEKLEEMAKKGCIYRVRAGGDVLYMAIQFVVGIYEFHLNSIDRELAELMEEYIPHLGRMWAATPTKQLRVVPVGSVLDSTPAVATYNKIRDMVAGQELISVAPCICRKEQKLMGHECDRPHETCLQFGMAAQYYIDNGMGRRISVDECMKILDKAEEEALVLSPNNAKELLNICCCCSCCCGVLRMLRAYPRPAEQAQSAYRAKIDPDACSACGTCLERCQIDAIVEGEEYNEINPERCIGCGLCASTCPEDAISMVARADAPEPPDNIVGTMMKIAQERGGGA